MNKSALGFLLLIIAVGIGVLLSPSRGSPLVWETTLPGMVKSPPLITSEEIFAVVNEKNLVKIDSQGRIARTFALKVPNLFPLDSIEDAVLLLDKEGVLRAHSKETLEVIWERGVMVLPEQPPLVLTDGNVCIRATRDSLFCLSAKSGENVWDTRFKGDLVQMATEQTIGCVFGMFNDQQSVLRLCGVDPQNGDILWTLNQPVSDTCPIAFMGFFIMNDSKGRPIAVDQNTGEVKYQHPKDGLKIVGIMENCLVSLAAGGSRLEVLSLTSGKSWSATLPSPLDSCFGRNGNLYIIDGKGIRSVDAETGAIKWQKDLGKTFNGFCYSGGLASTYKEDFLARGTYFSCFDFARGTEIWTVMDSGFFWMPKAWKTGDVAVCRSGVVRLVQRPQGAAVSAPTVPMPLPKAPAAFPSVFGSGAFPASRTAPVKTASGSRPPDEGLPELGASQTW